MNFSDLTPHGYCLAWDPGLIWLEAASDILIAAAYYSIPAALLVFLRRRRDVAFRPVFGLFAAFILACGTTHIMGTLTLWVPLYWMDGAIKAVTAALSVATAIILWPLLPKAIALPAPSELRAANAQLERQIMERDAVAALLLDSESRLRELYARSPAALHATDAGGYILDVSNRWCALTGYGREEVIGRQIAGFYHQDDQPAALADLAALNAGNGPCATERRLMCKSGDIREVTGSIETETNEAGQLRRILVALTDVTDQRAAERALWASEERLRHAQKMEAVGRLTGGIAHDFNNVLTTIMGSLELIETRAEADERTGRLARNALEGARRAARLTSQLLSFSRRQLLMPETLSPHAAVADVTELLTRTIGKGITLRVAPRTGEEWSMVADAAQLEMALLNLVINARDAIQEGRVEKGEIAIRFDNRRIAPGEEDGLDAGDYVGISVSDNGAGMAPDVLARAFDPFFTTKPPGSGTGLGLAQVYGFTTQSGGKVRIVSELGKGTTVELLLPRAGVEVAGVGLEERQEV
jgi:PAS domain S-box-containing protein